MFRQAPKLSIAFALTVVGLLLGSARAVACATAGYSYAGIQASRQAFGVRAIVTALPGFEVRAGQVGGWVGVGGPGQGPNGADEWLQVGFSGFPWTHGNDLYYELARPGLGPTYHSLATNVPIGTRLQIAVYELRTRPNTWQISVNGSPAAKPIFLPASHGRWAPIATSESWDIGSPHTCNSFLYSFRGVSVAQVPGGGWRPITTGTAIRRGTTTLVWDPGGGSFVAAGARTLPFVAAGP